MELIRAAGGVVVRPGEPWPEVLVVHRPAYDDWSLPKGKLDLGERFKDAAVREVHEETGVVATRQRKLGETHYRDRNGRFKEVRWWLMEPLDHADRPPDREVDEVAWWPIDRALAELTYRPDRWLLTRAIVPRGATSLLVVRHAHAGERKSWDGPDEQRPLSDRGLRQAKLLVDLLGAWDLGAVLSSPYVRCLDTVRPIAAEHGIEVAIDDRLAEYTKPGKVAGLLAETARDAAWCTHGDIVEALVTRLADRGVARQRRWEKGSVWVLALEGGEVTQARYIAPLA